MTRLAQDTVERVGRDLARSRGSDTPNIVTDTGDTGSATSAATLREDSSPVSSPTSWWNCRPAQGSAPGRPASLRVASRRPAVGWIAFALGTPPLRRECVVRREYGRTHCTTVAGNMRRPRRRVQERVSHDRLQRHERIGGSPPAPARRRRIGWPPGARDRNGNCRGVGARRLPCRRMSPRTGGSVRPVARVGAHDRAPVRRAAVSGVRIPAGGVMTHGDSTRRGPLLGAEGRTASRVLTRSRRCRGCCPSWARLAATGRGPVDVRSTIGSHASPTGR